ncbi:hypothetical protein MNEG_10739 [Monoraphidium neglectum]|uniref:Uncharacterized protein n=1 Tax=Monoraphidium neglectum TaxID=145388 RepID=A0A0D2M0R8_9CHLO|nr:hypothetical protein MNEG_10739 [Monoraphidium neglectum]KIY97224.1 hypothetical protein MNEG_10739 [Monoraphidium neglectum]|eukprot:XP_013896244.1 hypothetical protein MNEG_10739 [Monoraphidium neglectum]
MSLSIDGKLRNRVFDSWRLGHDPGPLRAAAPLPAPVRLAASDAVDYLHTRAAALRNHLVQSAGRFYVLTGAAGGALEVFEVAPGEGGGVPLAVVPLAELPALEAADPTTQPAEPPLDASLAAAPLAPLAGAEGGAGRLLLVSEGRGDLRAVELREGGAVLRSAPLFPLRPRAPLAGVRPFVLLEAFPAAGAGEPRRWHGGLSWVGRPWMGRRWPAALPFGGPPPPGLWAPGWEAPWGLVHCIVWAVKEAPPGGLSSGARRHCEVWALLLRVESHAGDACEGGAAPPPLSLSLESAQRLQATADVPHACAAAPRAGALLLAAAPPPDGEEDAGAHTHAGLGAASGGSGADGAAAPAKQSPSAGEPGTGGAGAGGRGEGVDAVGEGEGGDEEDDGDDVDPRTLAQAVARLAQFTSEEHLGGA